MSRLIYQRNKTQMENSQTLLSISEWLNSHPLTSQLYAVLSGPGISDALAQFYKLDGRSTPEGLWLNTPWQEWHSVMPYLVPLRADSPFINWVAGNSFTHWGWLALSSHPQLQLVGQLKSMTKINFPNEKVVFFRFWNGHFLSSILMASTPEQQKNLIQGFNSIWTGKTAIDLPVCSKIQPATSVITLTQEQLNPLYQQKQSQRWQKLKDYFVQRYPKRSRSLGEKQTRLFISLILEKSEKYGIRRNDQTSQYLDLSLMLGSHFDCDPMLAPWVKARLKDAAKEIISLGLLRNDLAPALQQSIGKDLSIYLIRLEQLVSKDADCPQGAVNEIQMMDIVREHYPERFDQLPSGTMGKIYFQSVLFYQQWGFFSYISHSVLMTLQLFLGHRVFNDPLYPWSEKLVTENQELPENERIAAVIRYAQKRIKKEITMIKKYRGEK